MTSCEIIISVAVLWHLLGLYICLLWLDHSVADGWELCNPYWVHTYYTSVNWFGACVLSFAFAVLCPLMAVGYWFYKLCTVGRIDSTKLKGRKSNNRPPLDPFIAPVSSWSCYSTSEDEE